MLPLFLACAPPPADPPPPVPVAEQAPSPPPEPAPIAIEAPTVPAPTITLTSLPDVGGKDAWDQDLAALRAQVGELAPEEFLRRHAPAESPALDHDPATARYLDDIVNKLALTETECRQVTTTGMVLTRPPSTAGSHAEIYRAIYGRDLPVLITLDSVWFAYQDAYLSAFRRVEGIVLEPRLRAVIGAMRAALPKLESASKADIDVFLSVAAALGTEREYDDPRLAPVTVDPANQAEADRVYALAVAEQDGVTELYGRERYVPFSRLHPQGRYAYSPEWWRMVAWMQVGRFVIVEDGQPYGGDTRAALALTRLARTARVDDDLQAIDDTLEAFVGPAEGVTIADLAPWQAANPGQQPRDAAIAIAQAFGDRNRIRTQQSLVEPGEVPRPLATTFALLPGRFTLDAHVLTNTTHDRVAQRRLPSPLDVLFTLGSDDAGALLAPDLAAYPGLAGQLEALRLAQGSLPAAWWGADVHHRWLDALRTANLPDPRRPPAFLSVAARRRMLQTELSAWAWLRADHALYAEESSEEGACSFPDVYVDPYPDVWRALAGMARHASATATRVGKKDRWIREATKRLDRIAAESEGLATASESLLTTGHLSDAMGEHLRSFIVTPLRYGEGNYSGWYPSLFEDGDYLQSPVVETRLFRGTLPVSEPRSLWIRSGAPELMVVTVLTGHGPTAFVGPVGTFQTYTGPGIPKEPDEEYDAKRDTFVRGKSPWVEPEWAAELRAERSGLWSIPRKDKFTAVEESGDGF